MRRHAVANQVITELLVAVLGSLVGIQEIVRHRAHAVIASRSDHRPRRG